MDRRASLANGIIKRDKSLQALVPILEGWMSECDRYKQITGYPCYWYSERSNVGILAAAAVRNDWVALEEFYAKKGKLDAETGSKRDSSGRCDLWLRSPRSRLHPNGYAIEAKQAWPSLFPLSGRKTDPYKINGTWKSAAHCAGELSSDMGLRIGALFVVPSYSEKNANSNKDSGAAIRQMADYLKTLRGLSALAAYFPDHTGEIGERTKKYYPGVFLALQIKAHANKSRPAG